MLISFLVKIKHLCITDNYSKFPIVKKADSLRADDLVRAAKIVFKEDGLPKKNLFRCRHKIHTKDIQAVL